jgi:hypothetical protein
MSLVKIIYPETEEEKEEATQLYESGKAASGEDIQQGEEDAVDEAPKEETEELKPTPPKIGPSPFANRSKPE